VTSVTQTMPLGTVYPLRPPGF